MQIIGLTGGIGSGKSTVADLFSKLDVPIIDTDIIARDVLAMGGSLEKITTHFGSAVLDSHGKLDRTKLRNYIFRNIAQRQWLENLLHPLIIDEIKRQIATLHAAYCIVVIPLLTEVTETKNLVDRVLVVDAPEELQIQRTIKRDECTQEDVERIITSQAKRAERLKMADDVLCNTGNITLLQETVLQLHQRYLAALQRT